LKQNILVLEDDSDIGNLVSHHLQLAGFDVRLCVSGDEVMPQARKHPPVLFPLDIMVPGHSGFEIYRQIRESRDLARIPIIFLTARAGEEDRVRGLDLGADDYITKPFGIREPTALPSLLTFRL
jgi:DNA-binding response OmpR family regulator